MNQQEILGTETDMSEKIYTYIYNIYIIQIMNIWKMFNLIKKCKLKL